MSTMTAVLAVLLGVVAIVAASLWLAGGRPQIVEASIVVSAPREHVFRHLVEPELLKRWIGGLVETRPLTEGGARLGARSVEVIEERGRRFEMTSEITSFRPPESMEVELTGPSLRATSRFSIVPVLEGTRVDFRQAVRYRGMLRLFGPLMRRTVERSQAEDLARLQELVEST